MNQLVMEINMILSELLYNWVDSKTSSKQPPASELLLGLKSRLKEGWADVLVIFRMKPSSTIPVLRGYPKEEDA